MALLGKENLQARMEQTKRHRVNHVGTKLNQAELEAFESLCERREQTPSELIRTLIQRELTSEDADPMPSPELVEIISTRLFLLNMLKPLIVSGEHLPEKTWDSYLNQIAKQKYETAEDILVKHTKTKPQPKS